MAKTSGNAMGLLGGFGAGIPAVNTRPTTKEPEKTSTPVKEIPKTKEEPLPRQEDKIDVVAEPKVEVAVPVREETVAKEIHSSQPSQDSRAVAVSQTNDEEQIRIPRKRGRKKQFANLEQVCVYMPRELRLDMEKHLMDNGLSLSEYIRILIQKDLNSKKY